MLKKSIKQWRETLISPQKRTNKKGNQWTGIVFLLWSVGGNKKVLIYKHYYSRNKRAVYTDFYRSKVSISLYKFLQTTTQRYFCIVVLITEILENRNTDFIDQITSSTKGQVVQN